jgi:hypothetical protein
VCPPMPYAAIVADLSRLLSRATSVRVVAGGNFDYKHRGANLELLRLGAEDHTAVAALVGSLATGSTDEEVAIMTPGDFTFAFYKQGDPLLPVTYIHRGYVRWPGSRFDAPLLRPADIVEWLIRWLSFAE